MKVKNIGRCQKKYDYLLKGLVVCGDCGKKWRLEGDRVREKTKETATKTIIAVQIILDIEMEFAACIILMRKN